MLLTIGHSRHSMNRFLELLERHAVDTVVDVRSRPYSRRYPHFRKRELAARLRENDLGYLFLGRELGARSGNPRCYVDGRVEFSRFAAEPGFREGLERIASGVIRDRLAIMCAENDPVQCHRMILICREIRPLVDAIRHIHADGSIESQEEAELRLMRLHGLAPDLFADKHACIEQAFEMQARKIAYTDPSMMNTRETSE